MPLALALAASSLVFPPLAVPALGASLFSAVVLGRPRLALSLVSVSASLVGLGLFIVKFGLPSIVAQGTHAAGERAVSVLREIAWAERMVVEQGAFDRDGDGRAELAPLSELTGHALVPRVYGTGLPGAKAPVLRPETYHPMGDGRADPGFFRVGGYLFALYLPKRGGGAALVEGDVVGGERRFTAYAWPDAREGGRDAAKKERVFFLDEAETICEADNVAGYLGAEHPPPFDSALSEPRFDAERCAGAGPDGLPWRRWKKKR